MRYSSIVSCALVALSLLSCKQHFAVKEPASPKPVAKAATADKTAVIPFFENNDSLTAYRLCNQRLTSEDAYYTAFPDSTEDFFDETTPAKETFYYPASDIRNKELVRRVQLRYNYAAIAYRIIHSYEWFVRMATDLDPYDEEASYTKKDTMAWIKRAQPDLPQQLVSSILPDPKARSSAGKLIRAFRQFDGDDSEGSAFSLAFTAYREGMTNLPELVSQEELDAFEEHFWDWYDKRNVVPGIDDLIKVNMPGYKGEEPSEKQIENLRRAVEAEKDIDRRVILALEYIKFDEWNGLLLLGDILESRIYSKYLLEAWTSWRAYAQMNHSPSSFSVIANNYYDRLRAVVLDTMVRHCLSSPDKNAECLMENLIYCEIIHRMDSIAGNSSFGILASLSSREFIHPRLLK